MIWVNEQIDESGIIRACIACVDQLQAQQKSQGWIARIRTVASWDEVPVNSLKLD
jgi:hypothetical protein